MNVFAVLLLSLFISVKSYNAAQDGTFDKNTKINMKSSTARAQDGTFPENAKTINVKSSTATQDGTFHENVKSNVNSSTATENGTFHENAKRNGNAGLNVVLRNDAKQESQLTRFRRSWSDKSDTRECYTHYFVGKKPPSGFIHAHPSAGYRYICQGGCYIPGVLLRGCFSTLYDLTYKIPIYAAYVLRPENWVEGNSDYKYWKKDAASDQDIKDINDKIDVMYSDTGYLPCIHRGHLVPAKTYSFSDESRKSTFVYTNAVPQYQTFNSGKWSEYEQKIRTYGEERCAKRLGTLYLLTGISDRRISHHTETTIYHNLPKDPPEQMPEEPKIVIPNSMWTAGCCVKGEEVLGSFGVIGNNVPIKDNIQITEVTVNVLERVIGKRVHGGIKLFPGNGYCNDINYDVEI